MLSKKEFKSYMKRFMRDEDRLRKFEESFQIIAPDSYPPIFEIYSDIILDMLKDLMDDHFDWISYWLYELDRGKDYKKGKITEKGKDIPLKTLDDLYNLLKDE